MRREKDSIGEMDVPDDAYYGIQTMRVVDNYSITPHSYNEYPEMIRAMAEVKKACAMTNVEIGALAAEKGAAIIEACEEVIAGKFAGSFPVGTWRSQGTGVNMNVNEVLANRANEILTGLRGYDAVHPNSHVNMCQSSNDVFPTCENIVLYRLTGEVAESARKLEEALAAKALEMKDVVRLGRTGIQDAVPMTWGQVFGGWHCMVTRTRKALEAYRAVFTDMVLGATVLGTGMGQQPGYAEHIYGNLEKVVGFPVRWAKMPGEVIEDSAIFDGMRNTDHQVMLMAHLYALASGAGRIANDVILFGSGPRDGFNELILPQAGLAGYPVPGSEPAFTPEAVIEAMNEVTRSHQMTVFSANEGQQDHGSFNSGGIILCVDALRLERDILAKFAAYIQKIGVNAERCRENAEMSTSLSTMVSSLFGYPTGVKCAKLALAAGISCKEAALRENLLPKEVADDLFDVKKLTDRHETVAMFKKYGRYRNIK